METTSKALGILENPKCQSENDLQKFSKMENSSALKVDTSFLEEVDIEYIKDSQWDSHTRTQRFPFLIHFHS